ncbi:MAG: phosphatidylserine decarboxylase family protein [Planctomycetaceae bacterium]|nr:phosphatidylserine decarboxylase family protein [Planctomycetaceae bacterium]
MLLTSHGRREWGFATAVLILLGVPAILIGWWWALIPLGLFWVAVAGFFRDPLGRKPDTDAPHDLVSPADGRISRIERVPHHDATAGGPAIVVRIFLSVLDVHLNRAPCDASVESILHVPGRYLDARSGESAKVNEFNLIGLRTDDGEPIGVRQVSGAIARRIVCPLKPGDRLRRGARFGMIKFGSTTELIVPDRPGAEVLVAEGDRVTGGRTILVRLAPIETEA